MRTMSGPRRSSNCRYPYSNRTLASVSCYTGVEDMPGPGPRKAARVDRVRRHEGKVTEQLFLNNSVLFGTALVRRECLDKAGGVR
jgi:hypothetical protein